MRNGYDAIIIGSGHNSLACALHLQAMGWQVGVFEQAEIPGGAVKTLELTEPGFRHDWAAMNLSLFAGSGFFRQYGEELMANGLEFVPAENCFSSVFDNGQWCGVGTDAAATRSRIAAFSEADARKWDALLAEFPAMAEYIFAILGNPMKLHAIAWLLLKSVRRNGFAWTAGMVRLLLASPRKWLGEQFESPQVQAMLAAWGMHLDFAPDVAGGAVFPYLEGMANQSFGMVIGKGGADTLTRSMVAALERRGGEVHCAMRVDRVLVDGNRATGVQLADGSIVKASRAVIANVAPGALVDRLLGGGSGNPEFDESMRSFTHAPGTMMIHLALSDLPRWKASDELQRFAYVHIAPSLDQMARTYQQALAGLLPDEPVIVVGQPTAIDPGRAPQGKHVLWVQVRMVPSRILGDAAGSIRARDWRKAADAYADRVIGLIERHAPGFSRSIISRAIVTPEELERDNPNLVGGDQICGSHHLTQHFLYRPAQGHSAGETPIGNLHLTGAAVWPGAGTGAGPGYMLGRKLAG